MMPAEPLQNERGDRTLTVHAAARRILLLREVAQSPPPSHLANARPEPA